MRGMQVDFSAYVGWKGDGGGHCSSCSHFCGGVFLYFKVVCICRDTVKLLINYFSFVLDPDPVSDPA